MTDSVLLCFPIARLAGGVRFLAGDLTVVPTVGLAVTSLPNGMALALWLHGAMVDTARSRTRSAMVGVGHDGWMTVLCGGLNIMVVFSLCALNGVIGG